MGFIPEIVSWTSFLGVNNYDVSRPLSEKGMFFRFGCFATDTGPHSLDIIH